MRRPQAQVRADHRVQVRPRPGVVVHPAVRARHHRAVGHQVRRVLRQAVVLRVRHHRHQVAVLALRRDLVLRAAVRPVNRAAVRLQVLRL